MEDGDTTSTIVKTQQVFCMDEIGSSGEEVKGRREKTGGWEGFTSYLEMGASTVPNLLRFSFVKHQTERVTRAIVMVTTILSLQSNNHNFPPNKKIL